MVHTVHIIRHGFRVNWLTNNWTSPIGLAKDPPLTAFGLEQAAELAEHFRHLPEKTRPTALFSSPYYRCLQTSKPVSDALGVPIFVEHGLSEWYSPVTPNTGLHPRPGSAGNLKAHIPAIDTSWTSLCIPPRAGESVAQIHQRCADYLEALIATLERTTEHKQIILVSHAATTIALARSLLHDPALPLRVGCCTVTTIRRDPAAIHANSLAGWTYVPTQLASAQHLKGGIQRDWGFEDIEIANGDVITDDGIPGSEQEIEDAVEVQTGSYKEESSSRL